MTPRARNPQSEMMSVADGFSDIQSIDWSDKAVKQREKFIKTGAELTKLLAKAFKRTIAFV